MGRKSSRLLEGLKLISDGKTNKKIITHTRGSVAVDSDERMNDTDV